MTIRHHPSSDTLLAYAAGTLAPALALVVGEHLRQCNQCTRTHLFDTAVGGALLEAHDATAVPDEVTERCLQKTRERITAMPADAQSQRQEPGADAAATSAIRRHDFNDIAWKRLSNRVEQFVVPGFKQGRTWARLFRFQPGTVLPRHRHQGDEFVVVLQGSYLDRSARFAVGDFAENDPSVVHELSVDGDEPCVALIASNGLIDPESALYRAAFRFLGI